MYIGAFWDEVCDQRSRNIVRGMKQSDGSRCVWIWTGARSLEIVEVVEVASERGSPDITPPLECCILEAQVMIVQKSTD